MDPSIVGTGCRIVRFERQMKRKAAIRDVADIEAIFGRKQLALVIDEGNDAGHQRKRVRSDRAGCKVGLKQRALEDIEPPCGIGRRIIGAALAEMAMPIAQDAGADFFHAVSPFLFSVAENRYSDV